MTSCVLPSQLLPAGCCCLQAWREQEQQQWQPCCWQQLELELQAAGRRGRPTGDWQVLLRAPLQQLQQLWRLRLQVGACTAHSRGLRRPPFTAGYVVIGAVAVSLNSSGSCGCRWVGRVVTHAAAAEGAVVAAAAGTTVIPQLHKLCTSCAQVVQSTCCYKRSRRASCKLARSRVSCACGHCVAVLGRKCSTFDYHAAACFACRNVCHSSTSSTQHTGGILCCQWDPAFSARALKQKPWSTSQQQQ